MTVYLDHAASTPLDERALKTMLPFFKDEFGNPSSVHGPGQRAEAAIENARDEIASVLGCEPREVIFTSGGSESDNLALKGAALAAKSNGKRDRIITSPVEHPAVLNAASQLVQHFGMKLDFLSVDNFGLVSADELRSKMDDDVAIVSVIHGNNEIGSINPIEKIGEICREHAVLFHTDAVQSAAHLNVSLKQLSADLLSIGAHKFYGPKGVGALYVRNGTPIVPLQAGGSQEFGLRAGTHNVPLIVGMGRALTLAHQSRSDIATRNLHMRDRIIERVLASVPNSRLTGHPDLRLPNHASFVFRDVNGNDLLAALDLEGYACSSGSACKTGEPEPSQVILATGIPENWALGSLRVTVGRSNTDEQIGGFLSTLPAVIERFRSKELA
jgi:cysteine desulfurase